MKAMGKRSVSSFLTVLFNLGWYGMALGLVLTACLAVVVAVVDLPGLKVTIPVSFVVDARTHRITVPSAGGSDAKNQDVRLGGTQGFGFEFGDDNGVKDAQIRVRGSLRLPTRSRSLLVGNAILFIALLALALWVLGELRALFRTLRGGQPFVAANAARIRRLGFAVIVIELARSATVFFENYYAMTHFSADGLHFDAWPDISAFAIVNGLIILVIAEVFRAGTRLDDEQSLTV
jgi:hypothetical protein